MRLPAKEVMVWKKVKIQECKASPEAYLEPSRAY